MNQILERVIRRTLRESARTPAVRRILLRGLPRSSQERDA